MRVYKLILLLHFSYISVFSYITELIEGLEGDKLVLLNDECIREIDKKFNCNLGLSNRNNMDDICSTHNSEQCQNIINVDLKNSSGCKNQNQNIVSYFDKKMLLYYNLYKIFCSKDEDDDYCLLGQKDYELMVTRDIENVSSYKHENQTLYNTCKSKKCIDTYIKNGPEIISLKSEIEKLKNLISELLKENEKIIDIEEGDEVEVVEGDEVVERDEDEVELFKKNIEYLNSEECILLSDSISNKTDSTSDTHKSIPYKISTIFYIIFNILLLSIN